KNPAIDPEGGYENFLGNRDRGWQRHGTLSVPARRAGAVSRRHCRAKSGRGRGVYSGNDPPDRGGRLPRHRAAVLSSRRRAQDAGGNRRLQKHPPRRQRAERSQRDDQFSQGLRQRRYVALGRGRFLHGRTHCLSRRGGGTYQQWGDRPAPAALAADVSCPIQGHFGELDKNPPPDEMRRLGAELTRLGKAHEFFYYADAPHGFNRSGWKGYRPEADEISWARTLEFFARHLGGAAAGKVAAAG